MKIKRALTFFGWPLLLLPTMIVHIGMVLNATATLRNGGNMPVYTSDCDKKFEAMADPDAPDMVHVCMTKKSHVKFLSDIFATNAGWMSIGDWFIDFGEGNARLSYVLWITVCGFCLIRKQKFYVA